MNIKPRLVVYAVSWSESRNLLFSTYLSDFFEVIILTSNNPKKEILDYIKPVKVIRTKFWIKKKVGLSFTLKFKKKISEYNPDYVLTIETHSITSYQSIKLSNIYNYKPVVFSWQNVESVPRYFFQHYIQKKVLSNSTYLIAGTNETKKYLISKGAEPNKIFINPETGYDEKIFNKSGDDLRESWKFEKEDIIVLYSGRLVPEKGISTILKTAKNIERINQKIKFVFIGKGSLKKRINSLASKNIFYKGFYDFTEMGKVLRTCDIFIYPSISTKYWVEQFGYSVIEAKACGKPVIVSNSGSLQRFVKDEKNGSIIEEGDEVSLMGKVLFWCEKLKTQKNFNDPSSAIFSCRNIALNYKRILLDRDLLLLNNWF